MFIVICRVLESSVGRVTFVLSLEGGTVGGAWQTEGTAEAVGGGQPGRPARGVGGDSTEEDRLQGLRPESPPGRNAVDLVGAMDLLDVS